MKQANLCGELAAFQSANKFMTQTSTEIKSKNSSHIKAIWGGEHPYAIFLHDGTKITIDGNKRGCWLKIGEAAKIVAHETKKCNGLHCRCMDKNCPNTHHADCVEHNPNLQTPIKQSDAAPPQIEELEELRENAANGAGWFNEFQIIQDFLFDKEVWGEKHIDAHSPAQTLINGVSELIDKNARLQSTIESLHENLQNNETVHVNILRGAIRLSRQNALHIAGATDYDFVKEQCARLQSEIESLRGEWHLIESEKDLPQRNRSYLITVFNGVGGYVEAGFFNSKGTWGGFSSQDWVIAWRELPEPAHGRGRGEINDG